MAIGIFSGPLAKIAFSSTGRLILQITNNKFGTPEQHLLKSIADKKLEAKKKTLYLLANETELLTAKLKIVLTFDLLLHPKEATYLTKTYMAS
jgi:hypothetical protein